MSWAFVAAATRNNDNTSPVELVVPGGVIAGDLLVAGIHCNAYWISPLGDPSGFTALGGTRYAQTAHDGMPAARLSYRVADGTESGTTLTWDLTGSYAEGVAIGFVAIYRPSAPLIGTPTFSSAWTNSGDWPTAERAIPAVDSARAVGALDVRVHFGGSGAWGDTMIVAWPAGYTERFDVSRGGGWGPGQASNISLADRLLSVAETPGAINATLPEGFYHQHVGQTLVVDDVAPPPISASIAGDIAGLDGSILVFIGSPGDALAQISDTFAGLQGSVITRVRRNPIVRYKQEQVWLHDLHGNQVNVIV